MATPAPAGLVLHGPRRKGFPPLLTRTLKLALQRATTVMYDPKEEIATSSSRGNSNPQDTLPSHLVLIEYLRARSPAYQRLRDIRQKVRADTPSKKEASITSDNPAKSQDRAGKARPETTTFVANASVQ
ncbi:hypothetical protein NOR_02494 [Metarhizium rileyi]|uniref:Uncharacterized protein n=1 Tax=Metarhizium rileyi (strain RCEF 4871) TaxID=1649241 RepID=A0A162JNP5_METRR|nr:hypothetical protein NOR_02494 [Metarhizium rileyi RCEF 4871]